MAAIWLFAPNTATANENAPDLPAAARHAGASWSPFPLYRMTGSGHKHLLAGALSKSAHSRAGLLGEGHSHTVVRLASGNYYQVAERPDGTYAEVGDADYHTHTADVDDNGVIIPEWFLVFWEGNAAGLAAIEASANHYAIASRGGDGTLDDTPWSAAERTTWENRINAVFDFNIPPAISRGWHLVQYFIGLAQSSHEPESNYRPGAPV